MSYTVETVEGERVEIVEKITVDGNRPQDTTILKSADGRTFRIARPGMKVEEISLVGYEEELDEAQAAADALQGELTPVDAEPVDEFAPPAEETEPASEEESD